jgi:hypothetical protein
VSRIYCKLTLLSFTVFAAVMLLIRAQPYDDHELRALLMPENCAMPCFMGIRPGVTTMDEAVKLLKVSGWVGEIQDFPNGLEWKWNGFQPAIFRDGFGGYVDTSGGETVYSVMAPLSTSVIEIWWLSKQAPLVQTSYGPLGQGTFYIFWYPEKGMTIQNATANCTASVKALMTTENLLYFHSVETVATEVNRQPGILKLPLSWFNFRKIC